MRPATNMRGPSISPSLMASRTPTSVNQVPPGTEMLVTPERSTFCTLRADFKRGEFRPGRALAFALALDQGIAVGDVAVGVDQAGHDPLPAGVDHLHRPAILELHVRRQRTDALDPVALDDDGIVTRRRLAGAVDQGAVADHQGLLACGGHDDPPIAGLPIATLPPNPPGCKQVFNCAWGRPIGDRGVRARAPATGRMPSND